jgi:hypothetical protein
VSDRRRRERSSEKGATELPPSVERRSGAAVRLHRLVERSRFAAPFGRRVQGGAEVLCGAGFTPGRNRRKLLLMSLPVRHFLALRCSTQLWGCPSADKFGKANSFFFGGAYGDPFLFSTTCRGGLRKFLVCLSLSILFANAIFQGASRVRSLLVDGVRRARAGRIPVSGIRQAGCGRGDWRCGAERLPGSAARRLTAGGVRSSLYPGL